MPRYAPLVPEDAREGVKAMVEGRIDDLLFDTMWDGAYDEVEALLKWRELMARAGLR